MLKNHLLTAWRAIRKNRLYTAINILSLSLGICGCIVIWLVASFEFSFDKFHPDSTRIYRLGSTKKDFISVAVPPSAPEAIRNELSGIENIAAFYPYQAETVKVPETGKGRDYTLWDETNSDMTKAIITTTDWFSIFKYRWLAGNPTASLAHPFSVVITEQRARLYFGNIPLDNIIGKELVYEDSLKVHVTGIIQGWEQHTDIPYTDFISRSTIPVSFLKERRPLDYWGLRIGYIIWPSVFLKLSPNADPVNVDTQLKMLAARHIPPGPFGKFDMHLQPLGDIHFNTAYAHDQLHKANLPTIYGIMAIALFILVLAIVNYINLSTAQSLQRIKEIGIRKVLGSARTTIITQFLIKAGLLTTVSVAVATLLVRPVMHFFSDYIPVGIRFDILAPSTLIFLLAVIIVTTLISGFYPARVLASYRPVLSLKGGVTERGGEKWWLRKSLIVFQFSISLIFIIVVLVMSRQIDFMLNTDYGVDKDAVIAVYTPNTRTPEDVSRVNVLTESFRQLPGVRQIVRESNPPVVGYTGTSITYKAKTDIRVPVNAFYCRRDFIPFYHMQLVAGENLPEGDSTAGVVINETLTRQLGFPMPAKAVGKSLYIYMNDKPQPIVGVIADFFTGSLRDAIKPVVLAHLPQTLQCLGIRLVTNHGTSMKTTLAAMEKIYKKLYPANDFNPQFMDEDIAALYQQEQKTAAIVKVAMSLAIFISCMGLLGLSLFITEKKAREIGIRKILGATVAGIVIKISREFVALVLLAQVIAAPIAWWFAHRWLQDFAYRIPIQIPLLLLAGVLAIAVTLATVGYQTIKAAMADPIKHLRSE